MSYLPPAPPTNTTTKLRKSLSISLLSAGSPGSPGFPGAPYVPPYRAFVTTRVCSYIPYTSAEISQLLLSQDVCHDSQLTTYEGNGYTYLAETFLPRLREHGVDQASIDQLTIANPRRMLTIASPEA